MTTEAPAVVNQVAPWDAARALRFWAALLAVVGTGLIVLGLVLQYYYAPSYTDGWGRVVGADAYNYLIIGLRGLALVVAGLASIVAATGCAICSALAKRAG